jgi:hypothetical protein
VKILLHSAGNGLVLPCFHGRGHCCEVDCMLYRVDFDWDGEVRPLKKNVQNEPLGDGDCHCDENRNTWSSRQSLYMSCWLRVKSIEGMTVRHGASESGAACALNFAAAVPAALRLARYPP